MIEEVEAGLVEIIIVKDMSRVGRDYLQVGFYTEVMFRKHGVRFIAVSNNIDSENKESAEFAPFLNLMSEWYAKDCSRKVKTVLHAKGNSGKPLTSKPIYGYKRSPDDKDLWLVDDEAAAVVRRIFQMTMDGKGPYQIAEILSHEKIEKPSYYLVKNNMVGAPKGTCDMSTPHGWSANTVARILGRLEYLGHTVNFRSYKESYKDKNSKLNAPEDWKVFEHQHEAIIDKATYDMVQKLRRTPRKLSKSGEPNPLTGLVFCGDCGAKMYCSCHSDHTFEVKSNGKMVTRTYSDNYNCSTYALGRNKFKEQCSNHYIRDVVINELVLDTLRNVCAYVRKNQAEFIRQVREDSTLQKAETAKAYKKAIAKNERRIAELENLFRKTYEDNANGKLSDKRFEQMSADYESEQAALETKNAEMQSELDAYNADGDNAESFIGLVKKYTEFTELTTPMLNEFVHKIVVHKAMRNEWHERTQQVDIVFNFIGDFKVPVIETEPTAEEIEALEKRRAKLQKQREANARYNAKQKELREQKQAGTTA